MTTPVDVAGAVRFAAGLFLPLIALCAVADVTIHSSPPRQSAAEVVLDVPRQAAPAGVLPHLRPAITLLSDTVRSPAEFALVKFLTEQRCLAEAMYFEARGEGIEGEEAIAEVVFHRMRSGGFPRSICGVVYQGVGQHGCQFSFACDGETDRRKSEVAWVRARLLAARILSGIVRLGDTTGDAISFHAADVQPDWADHLEKTIQIGNHVFYRALPRTRPS